LRRDGSDRNCLSWRSPKPWPCDHPNWPPVTWRGCELRILGVSLAIDDFGTGHSSLSRLKLLNVNCVKIDQSLIKDCTANPHDGPLCRAAIALGLALGLEVVAEGVETEAQRQFLAQEHCSTIQGYLIAKPMPAAGAFMLTGSLLKVLRIPAGHQAG
jgi:EAL domain-containing protein (putative c-di-GMP-specific phosphodiesterase class I)